MHFEVRRIESSLRITASLAPCILSIYCYYRLDSSGTWTTDQPHRAKLSGATMDIGMLTTLFVHSLLAKSRHR